MKGKIEEDTLYAKGKYMYDIAGWTLQSPFSEERNSTLAGYLLQQSLELCLHHVLELNGEKTIFIHDIGRLLTAVEETAKPFPFTKETAATLLLMSGTIAAWESKTRYVKGVVLERRVVEMAMVLVKEVVDELDGYKEGGVGTTELRN